ncbi:MAG TPA: PAS domain S-box protein [Chloroflexota bacterium]|nr:PAS domain S-box protein [Chloroflexota bacterium]
MPHRDAFERLVASITDHGVFMLDRAGHVQSWNAGASRITGYAAEDVVGAHLSQLYMPRLRDQAAKHLDIARTKGHMWEEGWYVAKGGAGLWANISITPVLRDSEFMGFGVVLHEATDRKLVEEETLALLVLERARRQEAELERERLRAYDSIATAALALPAAPVQVLREILQQTTRALHADTAIIFLAKGGRLIPWAAAGIPEAKWPPPIELGDGFVGKIAAERQGRSLPNPDDPDHSLPQATLVGASAVVAAPMLLNNERLVGVLQVGSCEVRDFTQADLVVLQGIGAVAARALAYVTSRSGS